MSKFHQGPADGEMLMISRAPRFLRVVVGPNNKIDALDLLEDTPAPEEEIHIYEIQTEPITAFVDGTKNGRRFGRAVQIADYAYFPEQPADHEVRTTEAWQAWVQATAARLDAE